VADSKLEQTPASPSDLAYQDAMLAGVSRTFALTIPELPARLRTTVGNAYLLCRIADTIEDAPGLSLAETCAAHAAFWDDLNAEDEASQLATDFAAILAGKCSEQELDLIENTARVVRITRGFMPEERAAILRCVSIMTKGMQEFRAKPVANGLANLEELGQYCYYVAGVVGEMLTDLFCAYSPEIARHGDALRRLSPSFGQGLQMTNILKDVWADGERAVCWLPADHFLAHGYDLREREALRGNAAFSSAMQEMVGITRGHLEDALRYTTLIPSGEVGIRRFCAYAVGMALFTLRKIQRNPGFTQGAEVKITRSTVYAVVGVSRAICRSNFLLERAFALSAAGLPRT